MKSPLNAFAMIAGLTLLLGCAETETQAGVGVNTAWGVTIDSVSKSKSGDFDIRYTFHNSLNEDLCFRVRKGGSPRRLIFAVLSEDSNLHLMPRDESEFTVYDPDPDWEQDVIRYEVLKVMSGESFSGVAGALEPSSHYKTPVGGTHKFSLRLMVGLSSGEGLVVCPGSKNLPKLPSLKDTINNSVLLDFSG